MLPIRSTKSEIIALSCARRNSRVLLGLREEASAVNVVNKKITVVGWRASKKTAALKARCSFKMVISRLREHYACGQFNSGRMIPPSRWYCPFIFLRLPLSIIPSLGCHPIPLVRTRYIAGRDLATSIRSSFSKGRPPARASVWSPLFYFFSRPNGAFLSPRIIPIEIASR